MLHRRTYHAPMYIRSGRLIVRRIAAGLYEHQGRKADYLIEQVTSEYPNGCKADTFWVWRQRDREPADNYRTKAEAVRALQEYVYGEYTLDEEYNR